MGILFMTPVADLGKAENRPNDTKGMLNLGSDLQLRAALGAFDQVYDALAPITPNREIPRVRCLRPDHRVLTLVGIFPMQKLAQVA